MKSNPSKRSGISTPGTPLWASARVDAGSASISYFGKDGKDGKVVYNNSKGLSQSGTWLITDDGMMCFDWRKWRDRCYSHKESATIYQSFRNGKVKGSRFVLQKGNVGLN